MITIAIADDHKLMSEGIALILRSDPELSVVKICSNGKELVEYLKTNTVDMVLVDLNMPVLDGPATIRLLKNNFVSCKIVVLSMYADEHIYAKCRELDINGYLHKDTDAQHLIDTIKAIHRGENRFDYDRAAMPQETNGIFDDKFLNKFRLSRRELEIAGLVRNGHTNQEIADMLFLSVYTVMTHRKNILHKLGVRNTAEMLALFNA
ncbi:DNA-binding response regulator, NarL/FixJ family, contains REC and HTH domains [Parapedobacter composti]|uniref:DNA-binding response regulator, NarL/FixJ family, contains REC and HTH domains n=1 Tax=Parapedobacter composti TaxID=623281 RepID=A0A1I1GAP8_9SPHI|nr:response regulator transcription factor [Parapedobacter composti]SFC08621.1 DNA-binding response regulator, NarL/FixJ family, contains REC and HTH domains [Parapedobacter composti]